MIIEIPFGIKGVNTRSALILDVDYNLAFSTMIFKSSAFFLSPHKCIVRNLVGFAASEFFANQSIIFLISFSTKNHLNSFFDSLWNAIIICIIVYIGIIVEEKHVIDEHVAWAKQSLRLNLVVHLDPWLTSHFLILTLWYLLCM